MIDLLVREALIQQDERGTVVRLDWQGTIRRWSDDYSFVKSNRVRTFLQARGIAALREKLDQAPWIYAVTGSLAASRIASVAAPRLAQIYVKDARVALLPGGFQLQEQQSRRSRRSRRLVIDYWASSHQDRGSPAAAALALDCRARHLHHQLLT